MFSAQRRALDESLLHLRSGRMRRRTFLSNVCMLGLSTSAALSLLEGCGASGSQTMYIIWQSEYDITNAYQQIVAAFNRQQSDVHVILQAGPSVTSDLESIERNMLAAHSTAVDIFSIDVVNVAEFAFKRLVMPISNSLWPVHERVNYLPEAINACTFDGQLWAAPYRTDVGLIYYRTDIVSSPPMSWEELTGMALKHQGSHLYGYVWEGAQYEGLVCNFDEVVHGYGGSILDPDDPTHVTVNSPEALAALSEMVGWIGTISPNNIDLYTEETARGDWSSGHAVFMRNWPYAYVDTQNSHLAHSFAIHPMLPGGQNHVGHSSIGGWQLAINAYIEPDRQEAAWKFIQFILAEQAQMIGATTAGWVVTLQKIYDNPQVQARIPLFKQLRPILKTALPRPVTPNYNAVSEAIRFRLRQAFTHRMTPAQALQALAGDLKTLVLVD